MTLLNVDSVVGPYGDDKVRRQDEDIAYVLPHKGGHKRIFSKIRKIAKNIMKKIKNKNRMKT